MFIRKRLQELSNISPLHALKGYVKLTTCNLSCQNSFSFALSKNGNSRTWCTKMYLRIGSSESRGETSPKSDLKGAPKRCNAVGEFSSVISYLTCWDMSSRFRSGFLLGTPRKGGRGGGTVLLLPCKQCAFCLFGMRGDG